MGGEEKVEIFNKWTKNSHAICFSVFFYTIDLSRIMLCTFLYFLILFILKKYINQVKDKIQRQHLYKPQYSRTLWITPQFTQPI